MSKVLTCRKLTEQERVTVTETQSTDLGIAIERIYEDNLKTSCLGYVTITLGIEKVLKGIKRIPNRNVRNNTIKNLMSEILATAVVAEVVTRDVIFRFGNYDPGIIDEQLRYKEGTVWYEFISDVINWVDNLAD